MGVDQTSLDRIRNATFPAARRGYDKHEVEKFLARLADWLETGAGDESRSDTVKRELERVGQRTGAILAQAEESAQQIRAEAEEEARETLANIGSQAEEVRGEADAYASRTRGEADSYADEARKSAEQAAEATREAAETDAREMIEAAQAEARRVVEEGAQRREDLEAVITDLVSRRDEVLTDTDELVGKLSKVIAEHRPAGADPFARPEVLDPLAREGEATDETEAVAAEEVPETPAEAEDEAESGEEDEPADEPPPDEETAAKKKKPRKKATPRRRGKVKA